MPDFNEICKTAWDSTKKEHQPAYDTLEQSYKGMLINRVGAIVGGVEMEDGPFRNFDSRVASQLKVPEPVEDVPAEVKEELVEEVMNDTAEGITVQGSTTSPETFAKVKETLTYPESPATEKEHLEVKGPLPKDFPKHELLHEAGINTYGQLLKCDDLTAIEGIGPATAKEIAKRLRADERALNK